MASAEPEYDLGVLLREDPVELFDGDPWDRAHGLAARTGLNAHAIWSGASSYGSRRLACTQLDMMPVGREILAAADRAAELFDA